jgi:predicted Zn-dependent peptidase
MGDTYSPSVSNQTSMTSPGYGVLSARVEVPPQRMAEAFKAIDDIADDLAAHEVSADEFASAANPYLEAVSRQVRSNSFWAAWLAGAQTDPRRIKAASEFVNRARSVTAADVHKAAQTYLVKDRAWRGQIVPDPAMPPPPAPAPTTAAAARTGAAPTP